MNMRSFLFSWPTLIITIYFVISAFILMIAIIETFEQWSSWDIYDEKPWAPLMKGFLFILFLSPAYIFWLAVVHFFELISGYLKKKIENKL